VQVLMSLARDILAHQAAAVVRFLSLQQLFLHMLAALAFLVKVMLVAVLLVGLVQRETTKVAAVAQVVQGRMLLQKL
jgi:hypothetical protein